MPISGVPFFFEGESLRWSSPFGRSILGIGIRSWLLTDGLLLLRSCVLELGPVYVRSSSSFARSSFVFPPGPQRGASGGRRRKPPVPRSSVVQEPGHACHVWITPLRWAPF
eukprot:2930564-Pyramimonas_sp.AAC.1